MKRDPPAWITSLNMHFFLTLPLWIFEKTYYRNKVLNQRKQNPEVLQIPMTMPIRNKNLWCATKIDHLPFWFLLEGSHNTCYFWRGWGSWILEKSMKTPSMYWGITIFSNFDVRVGENVSFWVIQKSMNFEVKWVEKVWCSRAFIFSAKV